MLTPSTEPPAHRGVFDDDDDENDALLDERAERESRVCSFWWWSRMRCLFESSQAGSQALRIKRIEGCAACARGHAGAHAHPAVFSAVCVWCAARRGSSQESKGAKPSREQKKKTRSRRGGERERERERAARLLCCKRPRARLRTRALSYVLLLCTRSAEKKAAKPRQRLAVDARRAATLPLLQPTRSTAQRATKRPPKKPGRLWPDRRRRAGARADLDGAAAAPARQVQRAASRLAAPRRAQA